MSITHATIKAAFQRVFAIADWNASHVGTLDHGTELTNVTSDQHHARSHAIDSAADHTSTIVANNLMDADANGLPDDSGLTVANTSDAIAKKHAQNTDTALGAGCVADDHGAAATDMVVNLCYGVGAPPAANTTTEGALFAKHAA